MVTESPPEMNLATFVEVLKRSELIDNDRLRRMIKAAVLSTESQKPTPNDIAFKLVNAGLLTEWQAAKLLKGKYRGFHLGRYIMRRPLGRGGMGVVYEAEHAVLHSKVAVKLLPIAKNEVAKSVSRFLAEARAAAKLNHPNLTRVHDCDVIDSRRFMVMELIQGTDLGELVARNGRLSVPLTLHLLQQAAAGLAHAHENGIVHRDVKPQNFLVNEMAELKVTDLGLALFQIDVPDRHTKEGENSMLGTVDFVAPEQAWESAKVDRRADIYSLGCTLYFMLTGKPPFASGSLAQRIAKHQTAMAAPLSNVRSDCPPSVEKLCQLMMEKKPQDRVQNMADVVDACQEILKRLPKQADYNQELSGLGAMRKVNRSSKSARWNSTELLGLDGNGMLSNQGDLASTSGGFGLPFPDLSSHEAFQQSAGLSFHNSLDQIPMASASSCDLGTSYWQSPNANNQAKGRSRNIDAAAMIEVLTSKQLLLMIGFVASVVSIALTLWLMFTTGDVSPINLIKNYD